MVGFINKNIIIFPYNLMKTYGEGTLRKSLIELLLMGTHIKRYWYLSHRKAAKSYKSQCICIDSPEPLLFEYTIMDVERSRGARYYQYTGISGFKSPEIRIAICF